MRKIVETRSSLSNTIKDTSTIMRNPSLHNSDIGVKHDCASILDSISKGTSCFHYFSHGTSLHRHSFSLSCFVGRCICWCCFIIWVDFMKGSCAWESEEGLCVNCCLRTYQSSCRLFYLRRRRRSRRIRRGRKRGFADFHIYL